MTECRSRGMEERESQHSKVNSLNAGQFARNLSHVLFANILSGVR
jgi:hypothetical protein